jgi:hypothetical protein
MYAFKSARLPYMNPSGPDSLSVTATPFNVQPGTSVLLHATANDTRYHSGEPTQNIAAAHYTVDDPSWITDTVTYAMTADDGSFNEKIEDVSATVATSCLAPGQHTLYVESKDANNNWGVPGSVFLTVGEAHAVGVSPTAVTQDGNRGQVLTYPLTVENLGNANDTFTVTLTSNWTATAPLEIADLAGCSQAALIVTVEVPADAQIGMSDVATLVVTSHADPEQSATAQLTTQVIGTPPEVIPYTANQAGDPGQVVTYTLSVTNTNEITDTFDLIANSIWTADAPATIGPLGPFGNTQFVATVLIPENAAAGAVDVASLQIASQNPDIQPVTATLATTANTVHAMEIAAPVLQQAGLPGEMVTYTLYLTNTGNITDTFDLTITHTWDVAYTPAIGPLAPGQSAVVVVKVTIPPYVAWGASETAEMVFTARGEASLMRSFDLITSVYHRVFLVLINK